MSSPRRRIETDVMKLYLYSVNTYTHTYRMLSDYDVSLVNDNMQEFHIMFPGPADTPYAAGTWRLHVELPDQYPYKSPSIGFCTRIYHPNIDEQSGTVCLDVINQTWSPMFDLINVFEVFLPQLLRYPNPADPLNGEAAAMLLRDPAGFEAKVKEYVRRYAGSVGAGIGSGAPGNGSNGGVVENDDPASEVSSIAAYSDGDDVTGMEL